MNSKKELQLLAQFRQNSRKKLTNISKETRVPISTIFDMLKKYEKEVIRRHTSLLDFEKLGFDIRANIAIKADNNSKEELTRFIVKHQNVNSVCRINSGYDFMAETVFRSMKELQQFLDKLDGLNVKEKDVFYITEDLKREEFMSKPEYVDLI